MLMVVTIATPSGRVDGSYAITASPTANLPRWHQRIYACRDAKCGNDLR